MLVAIPCWVAIDDPLWARLIMLAAAIGFFISTALLIFNDHTWFNPAETDPPAWHEIFRLLAGPIIAGIVCADRAARRLGPGRLVGRTGHLAAPADRSTCGSPTPT